MDKRDEGDGKGVVGYSGGASCGLSNAGRRFHRRRGGVNRNLEEPTHSKC